MGLKSALYIDESIKLRSKNSRTQSHLGGQKWRFITCNSDFVENFVDSEIRCHCWKPECCDTFVKQETSCLALMLALFGKKKITEEQVAKLFVANTLEAVDNGWPIVREFIIDSPEFPSAPEIGEEDYGKFLMIVLAANFSYIPKYFDAGVDREIIRRSVHRFSEIFDIKPEQLAKKLKEYKSFLSRVNMPSENMKYAISKAIFYKYGLNCFQEEYFRSLNTPNPIFLKNLDEVTAHFIWDWEKFKDKFKVKETENMG